MGIEMSIITDIPEISNTTNNLQRSMINSYRPDKALVLALGITTGTAPYVPVATITPPTTPPIFTEPPRL